MTSCRCPYFSALVVFSFLAALSAVGTTEKISDKRLCADRECQTVISKARTLARHRPRDPAFLPFERGVIIDVLSKEAGKRTDLWGGSVNGKYGYFPRSFVREYNVIVPNPTFEVETEEHIPLEDRIMGRGAPSEPPASTPPAQEKEANLENKEPVQDETEVDETEVNEEPVDTDAGTQFDEGGREPDKASETTDDQSGEKKGVEEMEIKDKAEEKIEIDSDETELGGEDSDETDLDGTDNDDADEDSDLENSKQDNKDEGKDKPEADKNKEIKEETQEKLELKTTDKKDDEQKETGNEKNSKSNTDTDQDETDIPDETEVPDDTEDIEDDQGDKQDRDDVSKDETYRGTDGGKNKETKLANTDKQKKEETNEGKRVETESTDTDVDDTEIGTDEEGKKDAKPANTDGDTDKQNKETEEGNKDEADTDVDETDLDTEGQEEEGSLFGSMFNEEEKVNNEILNEKRVDVYTNKTSDSLQEGGTEKDKDSIDTLKHDKGDDKQSDHIDRDRINDDENKEAKDIYKPIVSDDHDREIIPEPYKNDDTKESLEEPLKDEKEAKYNQYSSDLHDKITKGNDIEANEDNTLRAKERNIEAGDNVAARDDTETGEAMEETDPNPKDKDINSQFKNNLELKKPDKSDTTRLEDEEAYNTFSSGASSETHFNYTENKDDFADEKHENLPSTANFEDTDRDIDEILEESVDDHTESSSAESDSDNKPKSVEKENKDDETNEEDKTRNEQEITINIDEDIEDQLGDVLEEASNKTQYLDKDKEEDSQPDDTFDDVSNTTKDIDVNGTEDSDKDATSNDDPDNLSDTAIISPFGKKDETKSEDKEDKLSDKQEDGTKDKSETPGAVETADKADTEVDKEKVKEDRPGTDKEDADKDKTESPKSAETDKDEVLKFVDENGNVEGKADSGEDSLVKEMQEFANNLPPTDKQVTEIPGDFPTDGSLDNTQQTSTDIIHAGETQVVGQDETVLASQTDDMLSITAMSTHDTDQDITQTTDMHQSQVDGTEIPADYYTTSVYMGDQPVTEVISTVIDETPVGEVTQESLYTSQESAAVTNTDTQGLPTPSLDTAGDTDYDSKGFMVDGTLFPFDYFDDPPPAVTQTSDIPDTNLQPSPTTENLNQATTHEAAATQSSDSQSVQPTSTEDVLAHSTASHDGENQPNEVSHDVTSNLEEVNSNTDTAESSLEVNPTSVIDGQPVEDVTSSVVVLGASFTYVTPSVDDALTNTMDTFSSNIDSNSAVPSENVSVSSDGVEDQVQPSLDQNHYQPGHFMSRKPLSTGSSFVTGASAESDSQDGQQQTGQGQQMSQGQQTGQGQQDNQATNTDNVYIQEELEWKRMEEEMTRQQNKNQWSDLSQPEGHDTHEENQQQQLQQQQESSWQQDTTTQVNIEDPDPMPPTEQITTEATTNNDDYATDAQNQRKVPDPGLDEEALDSPGLLSLQTYEPKIKALIDMLPPSIQSVLEQEPLGMSPMISVLVSLSSTVLVLLVTCIACSCRGEKKSAQQEALGIIRGLEDQLFIATKEKENLEDEVQLKEKKIEDLESDLYNQQATAGNLESDINSYRDKLTQIDSLKKQISLLQQEVSDNKHEVGELHTDIKSRTETIKKLEQVVTGQEQEKEGLQARIYEIEEDVLRKNKSYGEKEDELRRAQSHIDNLTQQTQLLETRKCQLDEEAVSWSEKVKELNEQIEQYSLDSRRMQEDLAFKENELDVLRDCFLQVKAFQGEDEEESQQTEEQPDIQEKLKSMMDVSRTNAALKAVEEERDILQNKLHIEVDSRKEMEDQIQQLKKKMEINQTDKMKAERQGQEAQTKLEVLSKYFKEKEAELTRQLGEQEVLKNQNISKLKTSDSYTQDLLKENEVYKNQVEDLKSEISKAERDFRAQIAANEKKAHENWLATRAAERELKESRHECGMLRQKLTELERKLIPPGVIRPITHRGMPPPGMMNGPPPRPPGVDRPGSRGSVTGHITPRLREDDYRASPVGPHMDRRMPPGPPRPPMPMDPRSPPPYAIRPPFPPGRSPPHFERFPPPPRGARPPFPRPPPPHLQSPPRIGSPPSEFDDSSTGPYPRGPPPGSRDRGTTQRHQSQV